MGRIVNHKQGMFALFPGYGPRLTTPTEAR
jgi:hypothetical protein